MGMKEREALHVSVYIHMVSGEFDDHLQWPFLVLSLTCPLSAKEMRLLEEWLGQGAIMVKLSC